MAYTRFMICSAPRSGTHMLRSALRSHINARVASESFNPDFLEQESHSLETSTSDVLERHIFRRYPRAIQAVGFILHRGGARTGPWPDVWTQLAHDEQLRVIYLERHDLLRRYLSHCKMRAANRNIPWAARAFEASELREDFLQREQEAARYLDLFKDHKLFRVNYESLCREPEVVLTGVQDFLGLPVLALQPATRANSVYPLEQDILNLEELQAAFEGSRWSWFFQSP